MSSVNKRKMYGRRATTIKLETMAMIPPTPVATMAIIPPPTTPVATPTVIRQPRKLSVTHETAPLPPHLRRQSTQPAFNRALEIRNITDKISRAVHEMDTLYSAEEDDELLHDIIEQTGSLASGQLKSQLKLFIQKYKQVHEESTSKANERDEILSSLADWFSCTQLSPVRLSKIEEGSMREVRENIARTSMKFEKLRCLQEEIEKGKRRGQRTDYLDRKSMTLMDEAMQHFKGCQKVVKNSQSSQDQQKTDEMANMWSSATGEIMDMLNKVRTEGVSALSELQAKIDNITNIVNHYQEENVLLKEQILQLEIAEKKWKEDNAILTEETAFLEERIEKFRTELSKLRKLLKKHESPPPAEEWEEETLADVNPENAEKLATVIKETQKQNPGMPRGKKLQMKVEDLEAKVRNLEEILAIREKDLDQKEHAIRMKDQLLESLSQELESTSSRLQAKTKECKKMKSSLNELGEKLKGKDFELWQRTKEKNIDDDNEREITKMSSDSIDEAQSDSTIHLDCNIKIAELEEKLDFYKRKYKNEKEKAGELKDAKRFLPKIAEDEQDIKKIISEENNVGGIKKIIQDKIIEEDEDIVNFTQWANTMVEQRKNAVLQANQRMRQNVFETMGNKTGEGANKTLDNLNKVQDAFQDKMRENLSVMERGLKMIRRAHTTSMEAVTNQLELFEQILIDSADEENESTDSNVDVTQHNTNNVRCLTTDDVGMYLGVKGALPTIAAVRSKSDATYDKNKESMTDGPTPAQQRPESYMCKTGPIMLVNPRIAKDMSSQQSVQDQVQEFLRRKRRVRQKAVSFAQERKRLQEVLEQDNDRSRLKSQNWGAHPVTHRPPSVLGKFNWQELADADEYSIYTLLDLEEKFNMLKAKRNTYENVITKLDKEMAPEELIDLFATDDLEKSSEVIRISSLILKKEWNPLTSFNVDEENTNLCKTEEKSPDTQNTTHVIPRHNFLPNLENQDT